MTRSPFKWKGEPSFFTVYTVNHKHYLPLALQIMKFHKFRLNFKVFFIFYFRNYAHYKYAIINFAPAQIPPQRFSAADTLLVALSLNPIDKKGRCRLSPNASNKANRSDGRASCVGCCNALNKTSHRELYNRVASTLCSCGFFPVVVIPAALYEILVRPSW